MRKNAVIFRFFTWIVLAGMLLVNVTPAASASLAQDDIQTTPTPPPALVIQPNDLTQNPISGLKISGRITDAGQKPLAGVTVSIDPQHTAVSGADGAYLLADLGPGRYLVKSSLDGIVMVPYYQVIVLDDKDVNGVDFHQRLGVPAPRQAPSNPVSNQPGSAPLNGKIPGKLWVPPAVEQPQPLGGDMQAQAAFSLGLPGMAFRYADTYGTQNPEAGYNDDPAYVNSPAGISVDGSGNLLIAESRGKRLLEYNHATPTTRTLALGKRGVAYYSHTTFVNPQDVAFDESGNIWIVDANRLVEFNSGGTFMRQFPDADPVIAGTANNQFNNPSGIAFGDGLMYVADQGNQRIQVYVFVGGNPTYFRTIGETGVTGNDAAHFNGLARLTFINHAIYVADTNNNRLVKCGLVGGTDFVCNEFVLDGLMANTTVGLDTPTAIAFASGSLYVTDAGNYRVVKCTWNGTLATLCDHFKGLPGDPGTGDSQFLWASDVAIGPSDSVYISDSDNHRVLVYNSTGTLDTAHTLGAKDALGRPAPYPTDDTHFNGPAGMVLAKESSLTYLYVAENLGQRLLKLKLNADGTPPSVVWTVGQAGVYGSDDAHLGAFWGGSQGNLDRDSTGRIYVPDTANHRVLIYRPDGALWGTIGETGVAGADNDRFNQPTGISIDANDNLFIADSANDRIQVFDSNRNYVATLGETGVAGYDAGHFNWPMGVSVDADGNIFVADTNNHRIQKCTLSGNQGNCLPFAGKTGVSSAGFDYLTSPTAVLVVQSEVYILDAGRSRVQVFDTTGAYRTTLVGDWGVRSGDMRGGLGIAVGSNGDVYVSDPINQRIQKYESTLPLSSDGPGWHQDNLNGFGRQYAPYVQAVASFTIGTSLTPTLFAAAYNSLTQVAELYQMDSNGNWSLVMRDGFGDPHNQAIDDLFVFNNVLYASTVNPTNGGQLYSSTDGATWTQVILPGLDAWDAELYMMQSFDGKLYIGSAVYGSGTPSHGARIFSCDTSVPPAVCTKVFEAPTSTNAVLSMAVMGNWLYAGMASASGGQIYRCLNTACSTSGQWQHVFTDGVGSADNARVSSLAVYPVSGVDQLFAGVSNAAHGARVFTSVCDESSCPSWTQINTDGFGSSKNSDINALTIYGDSGKLLAITHNETTGLQIWGYNGTDWGTNPFLSYPGFGNSTNYSIYSPAGVTVFNHMLVVGTENLRNGGGVWASDPSAYSIMGVVTGLSQIVYVSLAKNGVVLQNKPAVLDTGDNSYKFTFTGVLPGVYVVTPFSSSFSFVPHSRTVTVVDKDVVKDVDFSASFRPLPLILPFDGTRLDGQTVTLNWADISVPPSVVQYEYQVSYNQDTFSPLFKTGKIKTTSVTLTALPLNKTFYWRVRDASSSIAPGAWSTVWAFTTPNPPGVPVLSSPISKSFLQNLSPAFKWNASTGSPDHYRIQVSQSSAFTTLDLDENTIGAVTTYQLESPLTPNRTYYWRVRSVSAIGDFSAWSGSWTFKTYPETPWLVFPKDSVVASSLRPTFQWDDSTNTGAYQIQISTFGITFKTVDVATKYYKLDIPLVPYLQYWWRVRAKGVGGYGAWSNVRVLYAPNPPGATSLVDPAVNFVVTGYQPVFSWSSVSGALHYNLQLSTDITFPFGKLRSDRFVDATTYDMFTISGDTLNSNGTYYWRVAACNAQYQCGSFTAARKFYTKPGIAALKSPDEGAFVNSLGVTFTWDDQPSPASPINSTSFTIEIDKNAGCTGIVKTYPVKVRTYTTTLAKGLYYWHVKAIGVGGATGGSDSVECRSINVETPPSAPALSTPAVNASVLDYRNIEFKWTAPTVAPDGYEIQVSRDSKFASVDLDNDTIAGTETSWKEVDLTDPYLWGGGTYYWHMRSKNTHGLWGTWSANRTFTTLSTIYGYVTDVKTLLGVDGVTVDILQGTSTTPIMTTTTYDQGYFILHNVPKGTTTVQISKTGYITTNQKVNITAPSQNLLNFGFVSMPAANQYSFVLTWPTNSLRSFDMHLWTPNDPKKAHIFPYNVGSLTTSPYVHMDAANNPYFTEVITVDRQNLLAGNYRLAVAQVSPTTSSPTGSGAKLEIYDETGNLVSGVGPYIIPKTGFGAWWYILDFTKTDAVPLDLTTAAPTVTNKIQNTTPAPWTDDKVMFGYVWLKDSSRGFADITVNLTGKLGVVPNTTAKTDISGLFIVGGLAPGTYTVSVDAPGYDVALASNPALSSIDVVVYSDYHDPAFPYFFSDYFILTPVVGTKTGGDHKAVAAQGHFTYLTSGSSLDIYNTADKAAPTLVKRFQPSIGKINDMVLAGNYAFLASDDGLNIVKISDPAFAYNAGFYLDYGGLSGVAVKGRYAYLVYGWADLIVVDINDFITGVDNPGVKYVSEFHIAGYGERITIAGNYAYIAYGDTGAFRGLYVVNIADPLHPQGIGFASVSGYPIDVQVSGKYAFMVGGVNYDYLDGTYTGGRLNVFDISNPSMPRQIIEMTFTDPVYDVKAIDGYVYLANGAGGMKILDATNPKFGVDLPTVGPGFSSAYLATCVDVLDKFAYVGSKDATHDDSKLEVVSLSNKAAPELSGSITPAP